MGRKGAAEEVEPRYSGRSEEEIGVLKGHGFMCESMEEGRVSLSFGGGECHCCLGIGANYRAKEWKRSSVDGNVVRGGEGLERLWSGGVSGPE